MSEAFDLAAELVGISSPSRHESEIAEFVTTRLAGVAHLEVSHLGDNVVARTNHGASRRVIIAGHLDTVSTGGAIARIEGDDLWGLGAADMKGTVAVMLLLAAELAAPTVDVTWIFYAREEIGRAESGLLEIEAVAPELLVGDVAILGEPTCAAIEAGCQGTLRLVVSIGGITAHSARPFMGVNAIHRAGRVIDAIASAAPRVVVLDGVSYAEQIQVVAVEGGRGHNVVPDRATVTINHRFAPDRTPEEAEAWVRSLITDLVDDSLGDIVEVHDAAQGAAPHLDHPVLQKLLELSDAPVTGKVGWTDVATFAALGVPAANFGAGDPLVAHHPDERVERHSIDAVYNVLRALLTDPSLA